MTNIYGYARVSTLDQNLKLQKDALKAAGCSAHKIFVDKVSGAKEKRSGLDAVLEKLQEGDTLVVWRLDRLGRSLPHLVHLMQGLMDKGIGFKSISDGAIDTSTASGELMFHVFSSLAQFEKRLIQERTSAGLASARARGRLGGRRPLNPHAPKVLAAQKMHQDISMPVGDICKKLNISRATIYRYLKVGQ
jgi:DNA invertase Pin-like site-specific DNA recombinase